MWDLSVKQEVLTDGSPIPINVSYLKFTHGIGAPYQSIKTKTMINVLLPNKVIMTFLIGNHLVHC